MQNAIDIKAEIPNVNIQVPLGNRVSVSFDLLSDNKLYNLDASSLKMMIEPSHVAFFDASGYLKADGNTLVITFPPEMTESVSWRTAKFDVFNASTSETLFQGRIQVIETVTNMSRYTLHLKGKNPPIATGQAESPSVGNASGTGGGIDSKDGLSAYELAKQQGFDGSLEEWLRSLKGERGEQGADGAPGEKGDDGKSAYQLAVEGGFSGSVTEWLASLKGEKGDKGEPGTAGTATNTASPAAGATEFKVYNGRNPLQDLLVPGNYLIYSPAVLKDMGAPGQAAGMLTVNSTDSRNIVVWEWVCPMFGMTGFRLYQNNRWLPWESASYRNINASPAVPRTMIVTTGDSTAADLYQGNTLQSGMANAQGLNIYAPQNGYEAYTTAMSGQVAEYTLMINGGLTPEITFPAGEIPSHGGKVSVQVALPGASQVDVVNGKAYFLPNGRKGTIVGVPSNPIWTSTDNVREVTPVFADQPYEGRVESWSGFENCIQVIAIGKNDINHGKTAAETIPVIEKITKCFKRERFVICTLWSNYDYDDGKREEMRKLNEWIRKKYGRFVFDLEKFVMSDEAFTAMRAPKTPDDESAIAKVTMPKTVSKDGGKHMAPQVAFAAIKKIVDMIKAAGIV